jgi:hypothetical protein
VTEEIWKAVVGFEGFYEVSNLGRVRSLARVITTKHGVEKRPTGRILRPGPRPSGHLTVALSNDNVCGKTHNVHTLVLEAFVGPRPAPNLVGRHLDGDENNCRFDNLVWSTRRENGQDRKWHRSQANYKLTPADARQIKDRLAVAIRGDVRRIAADFKVSVDTIYRIREGYMHADV